jgi:multidrug efflux pump
VMGGMITATALGVFFVPVFYVVVRKVFGSKDAEHKHDAQIAHPAPQEEKI